MGFREGICRLCLEKCESFKAIDRNTTNVLDILLLKIDFTVIQRPVICKNCEEMLIKCFDFKTTCLRTYDYIVPYVDKEENAKLDLKYVCLNKDVTGTGIPEDQDICGFCMGLIKKCSTQSINVDDIMLKKMIELCLPEVDLSIFKKPAICVPCHGALENCFRFVMNCLVVEEKTKKYGETLDVKNKGQIELSNLLQFTMRDITSEVGGNSVNIMKVEEKFCEDRINPDEREIGNGGDVIKLEQMSFDDNEDANDDVENKNGNFMEMEDQTVDNEHQFMPKSMLACKEESNNLYFIKKEEIFCEDNKTKHKEENLVEMEDQKFLLDKEIEIKTDDHDFNWLADGIILPHPVVSTRLCESPKCLISNLEGKSCSKETLTNKRILKERMYHCECCSFQTKHKYYLKSHFRKHKDPSDVTIYKCVSCSFQTIYKYNLERHLLKHEGPSEVTMYKCDSCSFQAKRKSSLEKHLSSHKDSSEVTMYKCNSCLFLAKRKSTLKQHLLKHKDPSKVTLYKCDSCLYLTKRKNNFEKHLLKHKAPSEVTMYKCSSCLFHTKYKDYLKKHLLRHMELKDPSEVTIYKCDSCSFQTKHKTNLKRHFVRDPLNVAMYRCDSCSFQAKYNCCLKNHLLLHKEPLEVVLYKCDYCSHQTKRRNSLKIHLLKHKGPSEVTMYKCDYCSYQTYRKDRLTIHLLKHKDSSKVMMYKCDYCLRQIKHKSNFKRHLLKHKDPSEITM